MKYATTLKMCDHTDHFVIVVIVESTRTFTNKEKPFHFYENKSRFSRLLPRITYVIFDDMPDGADHWARERHQRNAIKRGIRNADPDALAIVSDVDELICKRALERALSGGFHFFAMEHFCDCLNWRIALSHRFLWTKTYANSAASILAMPDLSAPREVDPAAYLRSVGLEPDQAVIPDAGWHFTWMGGVDRHLEKMNAFSHQE